MSKFINSGVLIALVSVIVGLLTGIFYSRPAIGHGLYAVVPPRIAVGVFCGCLWYLSFVLSRKIWLSNANGKKLYLALIFAVTFLIFIFSAVFPIDGLYWY